MSTIQILEASMQRANIFAGILRFEQIVTEEQIVHDTLTSQLPLLTLYIWI
jgi:hypothetical protein